jgi:hypothetical protein
MTEVLLEPVMIRVVPWDWIEERMLEPKVVEGLVDDRVELVKTMRDEELG